MGETVKKVIITLVVIALLCGAVWGALVLYRNAQKEPVRVYAVSDFAQTEYWGDSSESYGLVTTDKLQHVTISDTQKVSEIYVEVGQSVKTGDALLAYDTTLSDLDLEKAQIELGKLKLQLETAEKDLVTLQNMRPHSTVLITPPSTGVQYVPQATPMKLSGSGTEDDPFYYLWGENDTFTLSMLANFFPTGEETPSEPEEPSEPDVPSEPSEPDVPQEPSEPDAPEDGGESEAPTEPTDPEEPEQPSAPSSPGSPAAPPEPTEPQEPEPVDTNRSYVVFLVRQNNALNAPISSYWGLYLDRTGGEITFRFFEPVLSEDIQNFEMEPEPYYESYGSDYTAAELAEMRSDKEQEIVDLELSIRMAEVELEKLTQEISDGVVYSKIDGTVKEVRDPDEAYQLSEPVIEVSGGGGYYIDVAMSEMEFGSVVVGQTVEVNSWQSGMLYEGTITEISAYPTQNADSWSDGNTNVSYYPFRVFVDESADLQEYEYVSVTYQGAEQVSTGLYLSNEFIRTDGARSYVFVRGADGLLEERTVETGRSLWGSSTEIRSGIALEDYIAFPYGRDTQTGAETVEGTVDDFYGGY